MASNYKFSNEEMAAIKAARRETKGKRTDIVLFHIPPYTPEMNPIEQIWKEIRKRGFRNEVFASLEKVVDRLCDTICLLTPNTIFSITGRDWIVKAFN